MPQLNNITLGDRATPVVVHTFKPRGVTNGVATLVESNGIPLGEKRLTISSARTSNGRVKVTIKVVDPVIQNQSIDGITTPKLVRTAYGEITMSFDETSSKLERGSLSQFLAGLCSSDTAQVKAIVEDLEDLY